MRPGSTVASTKEGWGRFSSPEFLGPVAEGLRKIEVWTARHGVALAEWPAEPVDPFFNVNTPEDVAQAARLADRDAA